MTTDTSEKGLENIIVSAMTGLPFGAGLGIPDHTAYLPEAYGGLGYKIGFSQDYDREYAVDLRHLRLFLVATQPDVVKSLDLENDSPTRRGFLTRLIADVVTGKLDVREAAAKLPDERPEDEAETLEDVETDEGDEMADEAGLEALSEESFS